MRIALLKKLERVLFPLSLLSLGALIFLAGFFAVYFQYPPYGLIREASIGGDAWFEKQKQVKAGKRKRRTTQEAKPEVILKQGAYEGYTLFSPMYSSQVVLVDMHGNPVHHWDTTFSKIWDDRHPQVEKPLSDRQIYVFGSRLSPNGDLLVAFEGRGDTPYGYGLAKLDKDSNLIWRYNGNAHHQFDIDKDGKIYALTQQVETQGIDFLHGPLIHDSLTILTPEGHEIKSIPLLRAFMDSPYRSILRKIYGQREKNNDVARKGDYTHCNSISVLTPALAKAFPMFNAGEVLVSCRSISTIAMVDPKSGKITWAATGPWKGQHDAELRPDGTILLLDNLGAVTGQSRILKYNPATKHATTVYEGTESQRFFTAYRGMKQQLPNGNLLITEAASGRIFEVNPQGKIVWQLINPFRIKGTPSGITGGRRYSRKEVPFLNDDESK
jgi:hypothetical protein